MRDEEIIELYFSRDERAIKETEIKYGAYLTAIAHRILHNEHDTEEIVNDTYLSAWRTIPPKRPDILRLFLARIARNVAIDRLEYRLAQKRNSDRDILLSEVADFLPAQSNVEDAWEAQELTKLINCFLRTLDARARVVFIRRYWHAYSIAEIAQEYGVSESYVKNCLFRTRNKLRKYLEKEGVSV